MQVKKIMTKNPACCTSDSTLQEVAHMMEMYDCGCIPVIDNHQTMRPVGAITDRDITIRTFSANKNPLEMKASDVMTTDIVTVAPDSSVEECLNVMENKKIRRVLVVDKDGRCVGIVAQADLVEHGTHPAQTANFMREVSESDRSNDRRYESDRLQSNESRMPRQNDYSFSQNKSYGLHNRESVPPLPPHLRNKPNESHHDLHETRHKSATKKESFFNGKMLLTLLGSVGLGAGLRYYLGPETENKHRSFSGRKIKIYNHQTKNTADEKLSDLPTDEQRTSVNTTTRSTAASGGATENRDTISGSVDSFNKTKDDNGLKPITEVGRTTTNT